MPDQPTSTEQIHSARRRGARTQRAPLDLDVALKERYEDWIHVEAKSARRAGLPARTVTMASVTRALIRLLLADPDIQRKVREHMSLPSREAATTDTPSASQTRASAGSPLRPPPID